MILLLSFNWERTVSRVPQGRRSEGHRTSWHRTARLRRAWTSIFSNYAHSRRPWRGSTDLAQSFKLFVHAANRVLYHRAKFEQQLKLFWSGERLRFLTQRQQRHFERAEFSRVVAGESSSSRHESRPTPQGQFASSTHSRVDSRGVEPRAPNSDTDEHLTT